MMTSISNTDFTSSSESTLDPLFNVLFVIDGDTFTKLHIETFNTTAHVNPRDRRMQVV